MYRIQIQSPIDQEVKISLDGSIISNQFVQQGQKIEVLIEEKDVLSSEHIYIETSDEILDITDYAKKEVLSSNDKPIVKYGSSINLSTDFGKLSD